jgi:predicted dinucleotide-binding enzyme
VIGADERGLRLALEFAERGCQVVCADHRADPSLTPLAAELNDRLRSSACSGRIRFTRSSAVAARHGQVVVMAVGPRADEALMEVMEVARNLSGPAVIVDESTDSPVSAARFARLFANYARHDVVVVRGQVGARKRTSGPD